MPTCEFLDQEKVPSPRPLVIVIAVAVAFVTRCGAITGTRVTLFVVGIKTLALRHPNHKAIAALMGQQNDVGYYTNNVF